MTAISSNGSKEKINYQLNSNTFPATPKPGDWLLVNTTGDANGTPLENWIYDKSVWYRTDTASGTSQLITERYDWNTGDSQVFTVTNPVGQIASIYVNGIRLSDTLHTEPTLYTVQINDLIPDDSEIVIQYKTDLGAGTINYYTQSQIDNNYYTKTEINNQLLDYYNITEIDDIINSLPSSAPSIPVTYDELNSLKNTNGLVAGQNYLLTDYMTTYIQPVTNTYIESGVIEPLLLMATSVNQTSNIGRSTLFPEDIIYYEITGNIGNGFGTEGFTKGKIYRRIDTKRNNDIGTDWRFVQYDRGGTSRTLFLTGAGYNNCMNNKIETYRLFNSVVGLEFKDNRIKDFYGNTIGDYCYNNTSIGAFAGNTVGPYFQNNSILDCQNNIFGSQVVDNTFKRGFTGNSISHPVALGVSRSTFEDYFTNATITGMYENKISIDSLPTTVSIGQRFIATDALAPVWMGVATSGGSVKVPVRFNGTNWLYN